MIYVDTNVFVFALTGNTEAQEFLEKVASGKVPASTSCITWDEFVWVIRKEVEDVKQHSQQFLSFPHLSFLELNTPILERAHQLLARGLKPRDALHTASALHHGINTIVSDDDDFDAITDLRRVKIADAHNLY